MAGGQCHLLTFIQSFHADITEAVEGEVRAQGLLLPIQDIGIRRLGKAQVGGVEIPVFIQAFGVAQHDFLSFATMDSHFHPAGQILGEIDHPFTVGRNEVLRSGQAQKAFYRLVFLGNQGIKHAVKGNRMTDGLLVPCGILDFAVIELGKADGAQGNPPAFIRADHFLRAVRVGDDQHSQQRRGVAVMIRRRIEAQGRFIPAFAQGKAQGVFPNSQGVHGVGLVLQALMIAGPAGGEIGIVRLFPVDFRFVQAAGCGVQPGLGDELFHGKDFGKDGTGGFFLGQAMGDPFCMIFEGSAGKETGFKGGFCRCFFPLIRPYRDFPAVFGARGKRRACIGDQDGLIAFHPSRIPACIIAVHLKPIGSLMGILLLSL